MTWYYIDESVTVGDRRKGPYTIDEIKDFVKSGQVKSETLVWHSGMENWVRWQDTQESKGESSEPSTENLNDEEQIKAALEAIIEEHKGQKRYAGFLIRGAACLVDNFILAAAGIVLYIVLGALQLIDTAAIGQAMTAYVNSQSTEAMNEVFGAPGMTLLLSIWGILQAAYFIIFTAIFSATPGKTLFNLHVEINGDKNVGWLVSTLRYVASLFTQTTLMFYGIGYLIVMLDPKRRALHDWVARTSVVYQRRPATVSKKKI
ncbi:MAG: RDD family protein [Fibrobacter sp.]|nr:RDD family protein [Fibrobacter sp.]